MTEIQQATPDAARILTDRIKIAVEGTWQLIQEAYLTRTWAVLGYDSWDAYCAEEFGTSRLRLPREERQEVVASLRESGLSVRAIAAATGIARNTVRDGLRQVGQSDPPAQVRGADGKSYAPARPTPPSPATAPDDLSQFWTPEPEQTPRPASSPVPEQAPEPDPWTDEETELRRQLADGDTVVVSLRGQHAHLIEWADERGLYVRVDRRTEWGNPFEIPADGDRETVITNYADHYLPHKPGLLAKLPNLRGKALGCWCAPHPCHADVLKRQAEQ